MSPIHDLFVGLLAIVFGGFLLVGAVFDLSLLMSLRSPRTLAEAMGKTTARTIIAAVGTTSIAMGLLIVSGWRIDW